MNPTPLMLSELPPAPVSRLYSCTQFMCLTGAAGVHQQASCVIVEGFVCLFSRLVSRNSQILLLIMMIKIKNVYCLISVTISHSESKMLSWWHLFGSIPIPPHCKLLVDLIDLQIQKTRANRLANSENIIYLTIMATNANNSIFYWIVLWALAAKVLSKLMKMIPEFASISSIWWWWESSPPLTNHCLHSLLLTSPFFWNACHNDPITFSFSIEIFL